MSSLYNNEIYNVVVNADETDVEIRLHDSDIINEIVNKAEYPSHVEGVVVGTIVDFNENSVPFVDHPLNRNSQPVAARSFTALKLENKGRNVALMFENGDIRKPVVMGLMHDVSECHAVLKDNNVKTIKSSREIVLECGKSSISLREDGVIVINGEEIFSSARKNNIIKGGTIHLN